MNELVVAFDVGATNARARIAAVAGGSEPRLVTADITTQMASARELYEFVSQVLREAASRGTVTAGVVAVAGPLLGNRSRLTNWPSDSAITLPELERAGLPAGRTSLVNDVVAGAWGANARICRIDSAGDLQLLTAPLSDGGPGEGTLVYVAPGTGLGAAALVRHGLGPLGASAVACESQHTQVPRFDGETSLIVDALGRALGRAPSWEDLISGRGLVHIYDALGSIATTESLTLSDGSLTAREIAEAARTGDDARAGAAIGAYYRTLGRFMQTLALTLLPCAAVVIGGASTEHNLEHLRHSGLQAVFAEHVRFADLLGDIPIYTVGGAVNLEGGVWLAARRSSVT